jgi:hypothetical protein
MVVRFGKFNDRSTGTSRKRSVTFQLSAPPLMMTRKLNSCARSSARRISRSVFTCITTGISRASAA